MPAPKKNKSIFDRMAGMASGDMAKPGDMIDVGDGFVTVVEERPAKGRAALRERAEKAKAELAKPKPKKVGLKKPPRQVEMNLSTAPVASSPFGVAVTRKVGAALAPTAATVRKITAWSFSRYKTYIECPLKAKLKFVDNLKEPGSAAMDRGSEIHGLAEQYARGQLKNLPIELAKFKAEFLTLVKQKPECEGEWAFTSQWDETGWFEKGVNAAWCRIKTDVAYYDKKTRTVVVIDHKTGTPKADHPDQLSLYALGAFIKFPQAEHCVTKLWYLDTGDETELAFTVEQVPELKEHWNARVAPMLNDTRFAPNPSKRCSWCFFRKSNGGPCQW